MGAKEDFSSSLKLETTESIRGDLSGAENPVFLYQKAVEILRKMEKNFDDALGNKAYDYFDGNVEVDDDKTEFEKRTRELIIKARDLNKKMSFYTALYVLAKKKLGISPIEEKELESLVQELLSTQEKAKKQLEDDLGDDGKLNNPDNINIPTNSNKLEFSTEIGTLYFLEIGEYNPETTPNKIAVPQKTQDFLEKKYSDRKNIEATNMDDLSSWLTSFCAENPQLLQELGISRIDNLSPQQAILLTSRIVQERLEYSDLQGAVLKKSTAYVIDEDIVSKLPKEQQDEIRSNPEVAYQKYTIGIDNAPVDQLLKRDRQGVCRNYAQVVKSVFDAIKNLQDPKTTQLANTYCKQMGTFHKDDKENAKKIIVDDHRWNTFLTVLPSGDIKQVVIDVTWSDNGGKQSYSKQRFLFDLIHLVDEGLLAKEKQIAQLEYLIEYGKLNNKSLTYKAVVQYLKDYYKNKAE